MEQKIKANTETRTNLYMSSVSAVVHGKSVACRQPVVGRGSTRPNSALFPPTKMPTTVIYNWARYKILMQSIK